MDGLWDPHLLIGRKIKGRYKLLELFARGGMGVLFRAQDLVDDKQVAVKVLHPRDVMEPEMISRFCAEANALREIEHPSVVRIIESGVEPGLSPWIAMELVEGEDLSLRLKRSRSRGERSLPLHEVLMIGVDIAGALTAVHGKGLVHRDVKPSNIVTNRMTLRSKLVDFGISKRLPGTEAWPAAITQPGAFVGTEDYAAREQHGGEAVPASDVYALALTLAEALGGVLPQDGERSWLTVLRPLIGRGESDRLINLLAKALDERPENRPTASKLREALEELLAERTPVVPEPVKPRVDPDAETRRPKLPPADRETRVPRAQPAESFGALLAYAPPPPAARPRRSGRASSWIALAAGAALAVGGGAWAIGAGVLDRAAPEPVKFARAPEVAVAPSAAEDARYQRIAKTKAAIQELGASFARDVKAPAKVREAHLRYDCTRMERLAYDVEGVEHPLAEEGRAKLVELASTYGKRCESVRAKSQSRSEESAER